MIRYFLLAVSCLALYSCLRTAPAETAEVSGGTEPSGVIDTAAAAVATPGTVNLFHGIPVDSYNVATGRVKRNQFIAEILASYNVPWNTIEELLRENG